MVWPKTFVFYVDEVGTLGMNYISYLTCSPHGIGVLNVDVLRSRADDDI